MYACTHIYLVVHVHVSSRVYVYIYCINTKTLMISNLIVFVVSEGCVLMTLIIKETVRLPGSETKKKSTDFNS